MLKQMDLVAFNPYSFTPLVVKIWRLYTSDSDD